MHLFICYPQISQISQIKILTCFLWIDVFSMIEFQHASHPYINRIFSSQAGAFREVINEQDVQGHGGQEGDVIDFMLRAARAILFAEIVE